MQKSQLLRSFLIAEDPQLAKEVSLAKTRTTKDSDAAIAEFQDRLAAFVFYAAGKAVPTDDQKRLFVLFYKYVEKQYFLGQEHSDKASGRVKSVTKQDLQKIDQLAKDAYKRFIESLVKQKVILPSSPVFFDIEQLLKTHDDFDDTILQAAIQKNRQQKEGIFNIDWLAKLLLLPQPQVGLSVNITASDVGISALNRGTLSNARRVRFQSREDSSVCPICGGYDGSTYAVNEKTGIIIGGPTIPSDTHPRCRCRYVLEEE